MHETRVTRHATAAAPVLPVVALLIGAALALIGQFVLEEAADANEAWHWIQHGVLFAGGALVGVAAAVLHRAGRARA